MAEEDFEFEEFDELEEFEDLEAEESAGFDFEDEFDRLREKTTRTSAVYDDMELDEEYDEEPQGFFSQITPGQRLILLFLLLLDIVVIAIGAMALFNVI
ncbi:MAG: hypothetical protein ACOC9V_05715 [Chloroflexota bacterium]